MLQQKFSSGGLKLMGKRASSWTFSWFVAVSACCLLLAADDSAKTLTVYSGRGQRLAEPLITKFQKETGIQVEVRYGGTTQLALAIEQEGRRSPADVFWAQDTGALEQLSRAERFAPLPAGIDSALLEEFRPETRNWVPTSARSRTLAHSTERVKKENLPKSVFELTDPKWKGRIGWAPGNASFQAFVTAMRSQKGEAATKAWLEGMKKNEPKVYARNSPILDGIAAGEIDLGLLNHYYLLSAQKDKPGFPVAQIPFQDGDLGNLVFVAGVGVLKTSKQPELAEKFVRFLISQETQTHFTTTLNEYPVIKEISPPAGGLDLNQLKKSAPKVKFSDMEDLDGTLKLLRELQLL